MNPLHHRGVMRMYNVSGSVLTDPQIDKERRTSTARGDEPVQEWILSSIGTEPDAMERSDEARDALGERDWEALLCAYRRFGRLRERAKFRSWLVRISFRLALDRLRSIKRRQQREAEWVIENARTDAAATSEFQRHLDVALEELPRKQRLVLILAAMEGHTLEEVSALLGVPVGTVKSRLFFAKKTLAEKLRCFVKPIEKR